MFGLWSRELGKRDAEELSFLCLLGAVAATPFSLPVGRGLVVLSLILLVFHLARSRTRPVFPTVAWLWLAFLGVAFITTLCFGVDPIQGMSQLDKIAWFIAIPVCACLVNSRDRLGRVLAAFMIGASLLSLLLIVDALRAMAPVVVEGSIDAGIGSFMRCLRRIPNPGDAFWWAAADVADITAAQLVMVGIIVTVGVLVALWRMKKRSVIIWLLLLLQIVAIVLQFKRGAFLSLGAALVILAAFEINWLRKLSVPVVRLLVRKWRIIIPGILALLLLVAVLPFTRIAIAQRYEVLVEKAETAKPGQRLTMWLVITPELVSQHPMGLGWCSLTHEIMAKVYPDVEKRKTLHSNIAEVLVGVGAIGLAIYVTWMTMALLDAAWLAAGSVADKAQRVLALVPFLALIALLCNGLVESNVRKGAIVLLLSMMMGAAARLKPKKG